MTTRRTGIVAWILGLALPVFASAAITPQVLYSGAGLPTAEGWVKQSVRVVPGVPPTLAPFTSSETATTPGVRLDTTGPVPAAGPDNSGYAGYFRQLPLGTLDRTQPFRLSFTVAVEQEINSGTARAGFSVLLLTSDSTGIELAFNANQIFAQNAAFSSTALSIARDTSILTAYDLDIDATTFRLSAAGTPLLTGPLVPTYTPPVGPFADAYTNKDLLFMGDDTSQASARFRLTQVSLIPEPAALSLLTPAPLLLPRRRRR